jgi:hypothetical protein
MGFRLVRAAARMASSELGESVKVERKLDLTVLGGLGNPNQHRR